MNAAAFARYVALMAGVTYLIRSVPLVLVRGKIKSAFLRSFLFYVPYAVLAAMTLPDILFSAGSLASGIAALVVALVLAWRERSLLIVALSACSAALLMQWIL